VRTSRMIAALGAALLAALPSAAPAGAAPAAPAPVRVSHGSPFAGCAIGAAPGSVLYPDAEVEPSVTGGRFFAGEVVGAWQQDRWSDGGARGIAAGWSRDGGRSFAEVPWPVSRCAPGGLPYERASDPWVSAGPEGVVYGSALSFDVSTGRNAVVATTSYDGGRTWRNTTELIKDTEFAFANDKNSVTADPTRPGSAYQVWDRLELSDDGVLLFTGPALLSTTRDFGRTWSAPQTIVPTGRFQQTIGSVIVVDPRTGTLYDIYESLQFTDENADTLVFARMEVVRSTDAGRSWSRPSVIADDTSVADVDPNTGALLRTGAGLPEAAIDPRTGELYVVYEGTDFTAGAYNQVQLVHSTDRGATWSRPTRVNADPSTPAFTPMVAVTGDGDVGVTYFDLRTLTPDNTTTLPTSTWLTVSPRGGRDFHREQRIAPVFDHLQAPNARGFFLGDYQGLTTINDQFRTLFVTSNTTQPNNRTDVRYTTLRAATVGDTVGDLTPSGVAARAAGSSPSSHRPLLRR
jgi:photosystem II stability/assembly factor-like uncharacterized protein